MPYTVVTDHPVAFTSLDHTVPHGTKNDNSRNFLFNKRLYELHNNRKIAVMDLGCSGGGFIADVAAAGHDAVGIEGSDYSKKANRAAWATHPGNLFTADIEFPFTVSKDGQPMKFDVITAWEVLEHLHEEALPQVFENIRNHLLYGGLFIGSASSVNDCENGVEYHSLVRNRDWWNRAFEMSGFTVQPKILDFFDRQFIRSMADSKETYNFAVSFGPPAISCGDSPLNLKIQLKTSTGDIK